MTWRPDATINSMRIAGSTWADIAEALGRPRGDASCIHQRARTGRLPCYGHKPAPAAVPPPDRNPRRAAGADPLPPPHPISWGALLALTPTLGSGGAAA
jgi:hypothetical protein